MTVMLIGLGALYVAATGRPKARPVMLSTKLLYRLPDTSFRVVFACMGVGILGFGHRH
jgi:hypothetical protein